MSRLDYHALRQYAQENVPGLLFVTVSGAHCGKRMEEGTDGKT